MCLAQRLSISLKHVNVLNHTPDFYLRTKYYGSNPSSLLWAVQTLLSEVGTGFKAKKLFFFFFNICNKS